MRQEATQLKGRDKEGNPVFGGANLALPKGKTRDALATLKVKGVSIDTPLMVPFIYTKFYEKRSRYFT